jgi:pimeloyl-ACP methyl ester carboxylesterase
MPYATAFDGAKLYYEEAGAGEPLLLISGQGGDHTTWDSIRADFAARYRTIVYDHRGTGQSDKPHQPAYTTRGFAQDTISIFDHLGISRAHAYGHSMGGRIGQWLGIDYPERLGALVLGATTPGNSHGVPRPPEGDRGLTSRSSDPQAALNALLPLIYSSAWIALHPEEVENLKAQHLPAYAAHLHYGASEGHDAWDWLPSIKVPTLVIHGSDDRLNMTANAYVLAERIPGAELYIVNSGRHGYHKEFREEASRIVLDFLARYPL